ncbi:type II toxin-antitoxin system ParD family antitoxin [Clavibacter sp. km1a]|uniref:type II toxin-antitoxin system ParD family antitoxin n=1 Tax=Clavibacter sp. km1a TaxID=3459136 RepID=UPI0040425998
MAQDDAISRDANSIEPLFRKVASGCDRSPRELARAGLRTTEDQEPKLDAMRAALVAGEASGEAGPFDFDAFVADKRGRSRAGASRR